MTLDSMERSVSDFTDDSITTLPDSIAKAIPARPILQASQTMPGHYLLDVDALTQNPNALDDDHEILALSTDALRRLQAILASLSL
ncbi:MAG: hypothetical protein NVS1B2_16110 [Vulcanimicrobiaceae bacterium]